MCRQSSQWRPALYIRFEGPMFSKRWRPGLLGLWLYHDSYNRIVIQLRFFGIGFDAGWRKAGGCCRIEPPCPVPEPAND